MKSETDRKALLEKRAALITKLDAIKKDIGSGLSADLSEQAVELENYEVLQEIARTTQEDIDSIDKALVDSK